MRPNQYLSLWCRSSPGLVLSPDIVADLIEEMTLLVNFILPNGEYRMVYSPREV